MSEGEGYSEALRGESVGSAVVGGEGVGGFDPDGKALGEVAVDDLVGLTLKLVD